MKIYHVTVQFKDSIIRHHLSFVTTITDIQQLKNKAKVEFSKKLEEWGKDVKDMISFEIYYYEDEKEISMFKYEI